MSWPEDDLDFEDLEEVAESGGDVLSAAELAAMHFAANEKPRKSPRFEKRRKKTPCNRLELPEDFGGGTAEINAPQAACPPEIAKQLENLNARQDKLAAATLKSLERISRRMDKIEAQPVPLFSMAAWQKGCLFIFVLCMTGFTALFVMSVIIHANGWAK
jgi:hypothetical protein